MKEQDNQFVLSNKDSLIRDQLFKATSSLNTQREVCERFQVNHKGCYSLATKTERIALDKKWTHLTWIKNTLKRIDNLRKVPTSNYDSARRIKIFTEGGMLLSMKISNHLWV